MCNYTFEVKPLPKHYIWLYVTPEICNGDPLLLFPKPYHFFWDSVMCWDCSDAAMSFVCCMYPNYTECIWFVRMKIEIWFTSTSAEVLSAGLHQIAKCAFCTPGTYSTQWHNCIWAVSAHITVFETVSLFVRLCYVLRLLVCSYVICVLYVPKLENVHLLTWCKLALRTSAEVLRSQIQIFMRLDQTHYV